MFGQVTPNWEMNTPSPNSRISIWGFTPHEPAHLLREYQPSSQGKTIKHILSLSILQALVGPRESVWMQITVCPGLQLFHRLHHDCTYDDAWETRLPKAHARLIRAISGGTPPVCPMAISSHFGDSSNPQLLMLGWRWSRSSHFLSHGQCDSSIRQISGKASV